MRSLSSCISVLNLGQALLILLIGGWSQQAATCQEPPSLITGLEIPSQLAAASPPSTEASLAQPLSTAAPATPAPVPSNKSRVVLLKNDRCLTGRVRQLGDQVFIEIDNSARIAKQTSEIQTIADDLEGVYRYKVSRYPRLGPGEHIRLARWSMANGLLQHASQHYLALERDVGSDEPIIKQLGIELREHLLQDEDIRAYVGLPSLAEADAPASTPVRKASAASTEPAEPIHPAVLSSYTDHLQPILLKRCSQSGCHGLSSTNRLKFIQPVGNARARISEQNCRSVMPFVEVDDSQMSTLVRYALVSHGLQKTAAISPQETKLIETLQSWTTFARNPVVAAVDQTPLAPGAGGSANNPVTAPAVYNAQSKTAPAQDANSLRPLAPGAAQLRTVPQSTPTIIPGTGPVTRREIDELDDQIRKALGEPPREQSKDPFDPAEFNRLRGKK